MSSLLKELQEVLISSVEKPPKHMRTLKQIMAAESMSRFRAWHVVGVLVGAKRWVRKDYKILVPGCGLRPVPHYGPAKPVA